MTANPLVRVMRLREGDTCVLFNGDASQRASIKAVQAGYPLRGTLRVRATPGGALIADAGMPPKGQAYA
ncbi:hypothetical protein KC219_23200, partial [Mycobacterium tuberculosis]|nr:hypothetical protein [Mycobacterium tuberculosis]